jgi:hypothetical protein
MNQAGLLAFLALGAASMAWAGHVFGTIRENAQPLRGANVLLRCAADTITGTTDQEGMYRLYSKAAGPCSLEVEHRGRRAVGPVYSYDRPTAYDFDLVSDGKGGFGLRKR